MSSLFVCDSENQHTHKKRAYCTPLLDVKSINHKWAWNCAHL